MRRPQVCQEIIFLSAYIEWDLKRFFTTHYCLQQI